MLLQAVKIKKGENDDALDRMGYVTKLKEVFYMILYRNSWILCLS